VPLRLQRLLACCILHLKWRLYLQPHWCLSLRLRLGLLLDRSILHQRLHLHLWLALRLRLLARCILHLLLRWRLPGRRANGVPDRSDSCGCYMFLQTAQHCC
jgi:hypothetical protein